ncbi:Abi family protein [Lactobacillus sp. PV037]|uniref:Abi family protein n=1 Tax=Lactobacillus sp. PV037 TaxID=2594496 RepID=UPI0022402FD6|nr:Abi family protein [Lactobacillus sp. PV037]QNQ83126.1 Abi family protein [Lactobacillus sp. PV037]
MDDFLKKMMTTSQLLEHMKQKGITFNHMTENDAKKCLRTLNYYFKLASYRKNLKKDKDGRYINLDFAYLTDLAAIDMQLRQYLLELCLDIEHSVKVLILDLTSNYLDDEDGYKVVQDFRNSSSFGYNQYEATINNLKTNQYLREMSNKYSENPPIWVYLETTSFGGLTAFTEYFYNNRKSNIKLKKISKLLRYCKNIRNACAHNTPILVNLLSNSDKINKKPAQITGIANSMKIKNKDMYYEKMVDLVSVFYLHKLLQSERLGNFQYQKGKSLIKRFQRHNWYNDEETLIEFMANLNKMIEYLKR